MKKPADDAMGKPKRRWAWVRTPQIFSSILFYSNYMTNLFQIYWKFLVGRCRAHCRQRRGRVEETEAPVSSGTWLPDDVARSGRGGIIASALESNSRTAKKAVGTHETPTDPAFGFQEFLVRFYSQWFSYLFKREREREYSIRVLEALLRLWCTVLC
jgi:hypothetical protein